MAFCPNCGSEMSDQAPICPRCGHPRTAPAVYAQRTTEGTAIVALVLGIAGFVVCPVIPSIAAIVVGNQARTKIAADPALEGDGLAQAGVVLGWVALGLAALVLVGMIFFRM